MPECADNLQLLRHPFLQDKCDLPRYALRQDELELPDKAMDNIIRSYSQGVTEKSEMSQMETNILPKRETLCLTRADILQKILWWKGKKNTRQENVDK